MSNRAITTRHQFARTTEFFKRLDDDLHAVMEETRPSPPQIVLSEAKTFEVSGRQISNEDPGVARLSSAYIGIDVAECHVYRVRTRRTVEQVQLSLVCGENETKESPIFGDLFLDGC